MVRNYRNSRRLVWIATLLIAGQAFPLGPAALRASEIAEQRQTEFQRLPIAKRAALPVIDSGSQPPIEFATRSSASPNRGAGNDWAAWIADQRADEQPGQGGRAWIADKFLLAGEEQLPGTGPPLAPEGDGEVVEEESDTSEDQSDAPSGDQRQDRQRGVRNRLNPELVRQGESYFQESCTACHEAERATGKRKTFAGWLATVRRMAAQDDADIPASQHRAIATYLASLNPAYTVADEGEEAGDDEPAAEDDLESEAALAEAEVPPFTLNGTLSPVYRGTDRELENKGFFPDVWLGIEWRPQNSPVSGKVVACTSCHGNNNGLGVELVEAAATLDLCHLCTGEPASERSHCRTQAELTMGRFIVPFGAFSGRVHPGQLRTVSPPLMYNMGRRVGPLGPGQPVIPMPYADEGANLHLEHELARGWNVTLDSFAVNGLQFGGPAVFFFSRSYRDNNSNVAVGGRATVGNDRWRFGSSIAGGELQNEGGALQTYSLAGADASYRHGEHFRAYYEYAIREEDSFPFPDSESIAYGNLIEAEVLLLKKPKISFLARYDTLEHRGVLGEMSTERFTYGLNWVLPGGSLLILDHEHWMYDIRSAANIFGLRWTTAF